MIICLDYNCAISVYKKVHNYVLLVKMNRIQQLYTHNYKANLTVKIMSIKTP